MLVTHVSVPESNKFMAFQHDFSAPALRDFVIKKFCSKYMNWMILNVIKLSEARMIRPHTSVFLLSGLHNICDE